MKALLIGCSSIAERRALGALAGLPGISAVDAASRRGREASAGFVRGGTAYDTPEEALRSSDAALVYVSTENGDHAQWAEAALASGRHVVVDKPAFDDDTITRRFVADAEARGLVIAEATVFLDHPRLAALAALMQDAGRATGVQACFSFPPLPKDNFRYDPARGGGAINDLGPYAAATARWFFGREPEHVDGRVLARDNVETAFAVTATYAGGGCFSGLYGFNTEYQNWMSAAGPGFAARLDRFCTPPPDAALPIGARRANRELTIECAAGDAFALMFSRVLDAVHTDGGESLHRDMIADAEFRSRLRNAAR